VTAEKGKGGLAERTLGRESTGRGEAELKGKNTKRAQEDPLLPLKVRILSEERNGAQKSPLKIFFS